MPAIVGALLVSRGFVKGREQGYLYSGGYGMKNAKSLLDVSKYKICAFLFAGVIIITACSQGNPDIKWDLPEGNIVTPKTQAAESINANIYVDATTSMAGFASNSNSIYVRFIEDLEGAIISGWKTANIGFYKFGTKARQLKNRDEFVKGVKDNSFYAEKGIFETTNIGAAIDGMNSAQINIVITDLFQSDGDVNSMVDAIKSKCLARGIYVGIAGIKSDYNGKVYDARVPAFPFRSEQGKEETYRPFYALIFGDSSNIEHLFEKMKANTSVRDDTFLLISKYIVDGYTVSLKKAPSSKDLNLRGSKAENQFDFSLRKGASEGTILADLSYEQNSRAPGFVAQALSVDVYRKFSPSGKKSASKKGESSNDITVKDVKSNGNKINARMNISVGEAPGTYSYLVYVQPSSVNGYIMPKWVHDFSSDNPTPKKDPNKTLNLERFIAGLINTNAEVSQPKIAQMIIQIDKF